MNQKSLRAGYVKTKEPYNIENIKVQPSDVPDGFMLRQEYVASVGASSNEQVSQFWRRDSEEQDLVLIEEKKQNFDHPVGASVIQKWYRGDLKGKRDKIEINILICPSDSEMEKTIRYYTREAYQVPFEYSEIPIAGENSWIPKFTYSGKDNFTVMFNKSNVFVRVYVRLKDTNEDELLRATKSILEVIENRIML